MAIRNFLFCCFGSGSRKTQTVEGVEPRVVSTRSIALDDKDQEVEVKSESLTDSLSSLESSTAPALQHQTTQRALCVVAKHTYELNDDIPYPSIDSPNEILIRTFAVGLNPIDWKSVDYNFCMPSFPWIGGRELTGLVEAVGSEVSEFKVGDRVWASTYYRDRRAGTFQELCVVPQHTVLPLPASLSMEAGACLGVAALTAAMTLWKWLGVPMPLHHGNAAERHNQVKSQEAEYILIWGGSTITGQFAIQLARTSGLQVIAVTSAKTSTLAKNLGAQHVVSRDSKTNEQVVSAIREIVGDDLTLAIDIVGNETGAHCLTVLSKSKPSTLAPLAFLKANEQIPENVSIAPVEMKRFIIEEGNRKFGLELNRLVEAGALRMPEVEVLQGLEEVEVGLQMLKRGDMGGRKLVVQVA
ncbi:hypothetical protein LTR62_005282 [Meristemomyces frigidus]|uniref:Enoyl reductase (ER) domain-containing protein n=1 Tax=Meristemomyces frigidus TaxID=1508187 RepID=A0AAN7TEX1_9PEZI|nr:hypothetical protein LTR62_005282 [Meristemomyces frigidus]